MQRAPTTCLALAAALAMTSLAAAQYDERDLYLISLGLEDPDGVGSTSGVMRIDPGTGDRTIIISGLTFSRGRGTYDPFRQQIVVAQIGEMNPFLVDPDGTVTEWVAAWGGQLLAVAPTGDGRIYYLTGPKIRYIDAAGQTHDVLDAQGAVAFPFQIFIGSGGFIYDVGTNALFYADGDGSGATRVRKVSLSPDGTQVTGPEESVLFDVSTTFEEPRSLSRGPNGKLFLAVDDNSNGEWPRLLTVNPSTLAISIYATCGYFGVGGQIAGVYSRERDEAVVLDTLADQLRLYGQGDSGEGTIWVTGQVSSSGGSGESAQLIEIGGTINVPIAGDLNVDGVVDISDLLQLLGAWGPCPMPCPPSCPEDLDGDCIAGITDLLILLANWS